MHRRIIVLLNDLEPDFLDYCAEKSLESREEMNKLLHLSYQWVFGSFFIPKTCFFLQFLEFTAHKKSVEREKSVLSVPNEYRARKSTFLPLWEFEEVFPSSMTINSTCLNNFMTIQYWRNHWMKRAKTSKLLPVSMIEVAFPSCMMSKSIFLNKFLDPGVLKKPQNAE